MKIVYFIFYIINLSACDHLPTYLKKKKKKR